MVSCGRLPRAVIDASEPLRVENSVLIEDADGLRLRWTKLSRLRLILFFRPTPTIPARVLSGATLASPSSASCTCSSSSSSTKPSR